MYLKVNYQVYRQGFEEPFYGIIIEGDTDKNNESFSPFFYNQLVSDLNVWIDTEMLLSEEYLRKNNVEFIIDKDTKEIIPIGLIDFTKNAGSNRLRLGVNKTESFYKIDQVIKNIIKAIKIKYSAYELSQKCFNGEVETKEI